MSKKSKKGRKSDIGLDAATRKELAAAMVHVSGDQKNILELLLRAEADPDSISEEELEFMQSAVIRMNAAMVDDTPPKVCAEMHAKAARAWMLYRAGDLAAAVDLAAEVAELYPMEAISAGILAAVTQMAPDERYEALCAACESCRLELQQQVDRAREKMLLEAEPHWSGMAGLAAFEAGFYDSAAACLGEEVETRAEVPAVVVAALLASLHALGDVESADDLVGEFGDVPGPAWQWMLVVHSIVLGDKAAGAEAAWRQAPEAGKLIIEFVDLPESRYVAHRSRSENDLAAWLVCRVAKKLRMQEKLGALMAGSRKV